MRMLGQVFEYMENRRRRENRRTAIIFGGGCLIFIVIALIMVIVGAILNGIETATVNSTYGDYASACNPAPVGSDDTANLPDSATPRKMLLLISDTQRRDEWHAQLPDQWRAENEDEVVLIGCVQTDRNEIEVCEYQRPSIEGGSYTSSITREQYQTTLILINPETSRRIDSMMMMGAEPDVCPEDDGEFASDTYTGTEVEWSDFAEWIESYVFDM